MTRYFCELDAETNKPVSAICIPEAPEGYVAPAEFPHEITEEIFNNLNRAQLVGGEWVLTPVEDLPPPPEPVKTPEQLQIEALQQQLATLQAAMDDMILGGAI